MNIRALLALGLIPICEWVSAQTLRDPTAPALQTATAVPASRAGQVNVAPAGVTAIRVGPDQTMAVIGGRKVKVGDVLAEGKVKAIRRHEVILSTAGGPRVLKLYPGVVKQAHVSNAAKKVAQGKPAPSAPSTGDSAQ